MIRDEPREETRKVEKVKLYDKLDDKISERDETRSIDENR